MGEKVSVIMGIYNCAPTLREAIDSIIGQTYDNWQLVMCDDCSTDDTYAVAEEYRRQYPEKMILLRNEKNMRLSYSLNRCLAAADGVYIARMDGDDVSAPERLEKQVAYLESHKDVQLVGTAMQRFDEHGFHNIDSKPEHPDRYTLRKDKPFNHATVMTYKYVYDSLGGYTVAERTKRGQDYDLWFRFFAAGFKGASIQEDLYFVREDANAFMRRKPKLYLWSIVTRAKGFKMVKMPIKYYPYILSPLVGMVGNEIRKAKVRIQRLLKGTNKV